MDVAQQAKSGGWTPIESNTELLTRSGVKLLVARARREDKEELGDFFRHLTPDDLRFRFLETIKEVGDERLTELVENDAVCTFLARNAEDGQLVAVATLAREPDGQKAEVALSTRMDWKHHGVSWTLMEYVLAYAKAEGFREVDSFESADNREAIKLEREMGFVTRLESAEPLELLASKRLS